MGDSITKSALDMAFELVSSPAEYGLIQVIREAHQEIFVASPYIKDYGAGLIRKHARTSNLRILTNLHLANMTGLGFDLEALLDLWDRFEVKVSSLGNLHAKVYVADNTVAFVTSANLTRGGLKENYEYGVVLRDREVISALLMDMHSYFDLGNIFDRNLVESIRVSVEEIRRLQHRLERSVEAKQLRKALRQKQESLQTKILENRAKGKTINAVFSDTIDYLLRSKGPLTTRQLHILIQSIHPDICDDSIDRVINGQHFGKKWKHLVRNAQQHLKQRGAIHLQDGKWHPSN